MWYVRHVCLIKRFFCLNMDLPVRQNLLKLSNISVANDIVLEESYNSE